MFSFVIISVVAAAMNGPVLPQRHVVSDDVLITESCRIVIKDGKVIEDGNGNGVIQVGASDIVIEFARGAVLRGSPSDWRPDAYRGYGIRINGHENVIIRGACIHGFWGGLWATKAHGLTLDSLDVSDNRRAYLKSTPTAEDSSDWLYPHNNDKNEWLNTYGAALYIEDSNQVTVRTCTVHQGQNALCLDRVNNAKVYDNDFSFNSGWGIALWRCRHNVIMRNALNFCVRGYSHGVYNRGQDSAGILMFEQNSDNIIAENSATHSGDGFFGFAGREALGDVGTHAPAWYKHRGNNRNLLIKNDFSYSPAHGIEMTFSFDNVFYANRLVGNAICGIWGGYSQDTLIAGNVLDNNGDMAYGLERGGINIEHGRNNRIIVNTFSHNKCGIHLWWDPEGDFAQKPWGTANGTDSKDNHVYGNRFTGDTLAFHLRGPGDVNLARNTLHDVGTDMEKDEGVAIHTDPSSKDMAWTAPAYPIYGQTSPVGARAHLRGRDNIIMTPWGPWDHETPLVRKIRDQGDSVQYDLRKLPDAPTVTVSGDCIWGHLSRLPGQEQVYTYGLSVHRPGMYPYRIHIQAGNFQTTRDGTLISAQWEAVFFKWTQASDPREHLAAWRTLAQGKTAVTTTLKHLRFPYGGDGPSEQALADTVRTATLGNDHFGMIARTQLPLTAGTWTFKTLSDDGVRVMVAGQPVIENWTWHGPTPNTGTVTLDQDQTVEIMVEHFEIDGYAVLELDISRNALSSE